MSIRLSSYLRPTLPLLFLCTLAVAGEKQIIQLRDYTDTEVKCGGFTLSRDMPVHITALGGGESETPFTDEAMFAYGWIINADSREPVWRMTISNTNKEKSDRRFDGSVPLRKGSYEVYYAAYGFASRTSISNFNINIDRRKQGTDKKHTFTEWLQELFGGTDLKDWQKRAKEWGIDIAVDDNAPYIPMFSPPKDFQDQLFASTRLGENEHIRQRFTLVKPMPIRIYALGERDFSETLADYGWIVDAKTRKRIWEMTSTNTRPAGGAGKNVKFDGVVQFPRGDFVLYYITDDSHSAADWNAAPPNDPLNYGVTLIAADSHSKDDFKLSSASNEDQNVIVQLIEVGNNETRSASFGLKSPATIRVYALGERSNAKHQMVDYGWIINANTRERVWTMDADRTEHAGGADKNRMIDETVTLPKGVYTVLYQTDDSHAYNSWNSSPPFDPEHWGISIYGEGTPTDVVDKRASAAQDNIIAQLTQVGDNANMTRAFTLDKTTHVRVYALGEGQDRQMYDYGWIEDADKGTVVWEMTYSMTFHAGGGRKNRMVKTNVILDKGRYILHYVSDDSHSYGHWNTDPPDDPTMWGITLYREE